MWQPSASCYTLVFAEPLTSRMSLSIELVGRTELLAPVRVTLLASRDIILRCQFGRIDANCHTY